MASSSLFFVLSVIHLSCAFTLSLPDKTDTGTEVPVQWTRDGGDPTSFGLMQRSLMADESVLSVTPVQNSGGATSGTATVVFDTAGQVLLAVIQQQSLASGELPNQLAAGKQLTVVQGVDDPPVVPIPTPTTSTVVAPPTRTVLTTTTTTPTKPPQPPQVTFLPKTSAAATSSGDSIGSISAHESSTATPPSLPSSSSDTEIGRVAVTSHPLTLLSTHPSSSSSSTIPLPSSISSLSPQSSSLPARATSKSKARPGVIAAAVLLPLFLLLLLASCWLIRRQRNATRYRVDRFTAVWNRTRRRGSARETISSFGNFNDTADGGGSIKSNRLSDAERGGVEPSTPIPKRQQKLQWMVDHLTERNATLEREMESLSSGSLLPFVGMRVVQSPPPVYVEALEGVRVVSEIEKSRRG